MGCHSVSIRKNRPKKTVSNHMYRIYGHSVDSNENRGSGSALFDKQKKQNPIKFESGNYFRGEGFGWNDLADHIACCDLWLKCTRVAHKSWAKFFDYLYYFGVLNAFPAF